MGWAYRFHGTIEDSGIPISSSCGEPSEMRKFADEEYFEANKVEFTIIGADGEDLVSGSYVGGANDRGWVLDSVRIFTARLEADPVRIEYEDGPAWAHNPEWGIAVLEPKEKGPEGP